MNGTLGAILAVLAWLLAAVSGYGISRYDAPGFAFGLGASGIMTLIAVLLLCGF